RERPRGCGADQRDELPASHSRSQGQSYAVHRVTAVRVLKRAEMDVNCDQLFWAANVGLGPTSGVKTGKTQNSKCFPVRPRNVWPRRALQEKTVSLGYGLAPMYQASLWSSCSGPSWKSARIRSC